MVVRCNDCDLLAAADAADDVVLEPCVDDVLCSMRGDVSITSLCIICSGVAVDDEDAFDVA